MKLYLLLIPFIFISCNAFEAFLDAESQIDDGFTANRLESLEVDLLGFWNLNEQGTGSAKESFFPNSILTDTSMVGLITSDGIKGNSVSCDSSTLVSSGALENTSFFGPSSPTAAGWNISFWLKVGSLPTGGIVETVMFLGAGFVEFGDFASDGVINLAFHDGTNRVVSQRGLSNLNPDWNHFSINLFQNQFMNRIYVNGEEQVGSTTAAQNNVILGSVGICSNSTGLGQLKSFLDSVGIWSRALTVDEINALASGNTQLD